MIPFTMHLLTYLTSSVDKYRIPFYCNTQPPGTKDEQHRPPVGQTASMFQYL